MRVLPRHHLRPGPVDVEDLRPACLQRREILVQAPLLDFPFLIAVRLEILAELGEPVAARDGRETPREPPRTRRCVSTDALRPGPCHPGCLHSRARAPPAARAATSSRMLSAARLTWSLTSANARFKRLAIRRERALERDDPITDIHLDTSHGSPSRLHFAART